LAFYLAVKHQEEQQSIAARVAAGLSLLWPLLQFDKLDETTPGWLHATTLQVEKSFRESEEAAFRFVQGSKWAVEPFSKPLKQVETVFPVKDVQLAMRATGPASIKKATKAAFSDPESDSGRLLSVSEGDVPPKGIEELADRLMAWGKLNSTGAGVKHTLNGGRGEVQQLVVADSVERIKNRETIGWARFTEDSKTGPCYFCAVLASKGAVYLSDGAFDQSNRMIREVNKWRKERRAFLGDGLAKVHDHCKCSLRPVYRKQDSMDSRAKYFERQWKQMFRDAPWLGSLEGSEDLKEFRRVYKRPPPYSDRPVVNLAAVRRNRELVAQELGASSPHARWWDRQVKALSS
jgi:hypothetical protein